MKRLKEMGLLLHGQRIEPISSRALELRWLLFTGKAKLIAASDDRAKILKAASASAGPVVLVELPV